MGLSFAKKKAIFTKKDFPKIRYKTVQYFSSVHAQEPKSFFCHYPLSIIFLALFLSFFSAPLLSLPFLLHIPSGCCKKLGVNYGQSL